MFNRFAQYEDAFRDWRRDGMPGLKPDSYRYVEFLTAVAVAYFVVIFPLSLYARFAEGRLQRRTGQ